MRCRSSVDAQPGKGSLSGTVQWLSVNASVRLLFSRREQKELESESVGGSATLVLFCQLSS